MASAISGQNRNVIRSHILKIMAQHPEPLSAPQVVDKLPPELRPAVSASGVSMLLADMWQARKLARGYTTVPGNPSVRYAYTLRADVGKDEPKKRRRSTRRTRGGPVIKIDAPAPGGRNHDYLVLAKVWGAILDTAVTAAQVEEMMRVADALK